MTDPILSDADIAWIHGLTHAEAQQYYRTFWEEVEPTKDAWKYIAALARADRFFLLTWLCDRKDADREWIYQRCREVEADPDNYLDLWAREHYKSTVITFAGVIQEIIRNPEITIGLFSYNAGNARKFSAQIKRELETNTRLKNAFPDIIWANPEKQAPVWSEERGFTVKRRSNPKEATVTPHGLIEGLPAGPHYDLRVYDDVITENEVTSPEQMLKALHMWRQSQNLGKEGGRQWNAGTIYHFNDPNATIRREELLKARVHPGTVDGTVSGKPVLVAPDYIAEKYKLLGPYVFSAQWLLNPVADDVQGFRKEWLRFYEPETFSWRSMNRYILVDPASTKKKYSDYTVMWVIGLGSDKNYYAIDCIRERLNLTERADRLFELHREYQPRGVGYEKYGQQADIEHIQDRQNRENYRFGITDLGGNIRKEDRIRKLVPEFENGRIWLPPELWAVEDGKRIDLVKTFVDTELMAFPVSRHDDMLDCLARILDPDLPKIWPRPGSSDGKTEPAKDRYARKRRSAATWMAA